MITDLRFHNFPTDEKAKLDTPEFGEFLHSRVEIAH